MTDPQDFELSCDGTTLTRWLRREKPCPQPPQFAIVAHHVGEHCESVTQLFCTNHAAWAEQHYMLDILALALTENSDTEHVACARCHTYIETSDHIRTITEL